MPAYRVANSIFSSTIAFPGLPLQPAEQAQWAFRVRRARPQPCEEPAWYHCWQDTNQQVWLSLGRHSAGYLLRFHDLADFVLSADGTRIDCYPERATPLETIRHLLLDQVLPLLLSRMGHWAVHASAFATPAGAVALVGPSGHGKSTLAASFALHGYPVLTDDCLLLEERGAELVAIPSYPGVRLWGDSVEMLFAPTTAVAEVAHYTDKKRLSLREHPGHFSAEHHRLRRMYFLAEPASHDPPAPITITRMTPREAFMELVSASFKLGVDDPGVLAREFQLFERIATLPLFYRLAHPHDYAQLPAVRAAILEHLS